MRRHRHLKLHAGHIGKDLEKLADLEVKVK